MTAYLVAYGPLVLLAVGATLLALAIRRDYRENTQARELLRLIDERPDAQVVSIDAYRRRHDDRGAA